MMAQLNESRLTYFSFEMKWNAHVSWNQLLFNFFAIIIILQEEEKRFVFWESK